MSTLLFLTREEQFLKFSSIFQRKSTSLCSGLNKLQIYCEGEKGEKKCQFSHSVKINPRSTWSASSPGPFYPQWELKQIPKILPAAKTHWDVSALIQHHCTRSHTVLMSNFAPTKFICGPSYFNQWKEALVSSSAFSFFIGKFHLKLPTSHLNKLFLMPPAKICCSQLQQCNSSCDCTLGL